MPRPRRVAVRHILPDDRCNPAAALDSAGGERMTGVPAPGDVVCLAPTAVAPIVHELDEARAAGARFEDVFPVWADRLAACFEPSSVARGVLEDRRHRYAHAFYGEED